MDEAQQDAPTLGAGQSRQTPPGDLTEEARIFYQRLEEAGQLVDVEYGADLSQLPPSVTHVRYPDGAVERIGFS